jgi:ceramide glucosyltransferase
VILEAVGVIAAAYQVFAIVACIRFRRGVAHALVRAVSRLVSTRVTESGVAMSGDAARTSACATILKAVRGLDPGFRAAIESHTKLHGEYELLCGVRSMDDPAVAVLREFPQVRVIECHTVTPNQKVGVLMDLAREAKHSILIVNDADIRVEPDYLARVTAPLADARVGLVTCLYRPEASTFAARFEGLGVATEFAPSALVARLVGVEEFAMGSTLAFRRADLERIGGFAGISEYLADDYQLGAKLHRLGLKCVLSDVIVATHLGGTWRDVWSHQVRWARTIRVSKFSGYLGLPVTFATVWAVVALCAGEWRVALAVLAVRMLMALASGWMVMRSRDVLRLWLLIPLRDLFGAAVWAAGLFGNSVLWRGQKLKLDKQGRIL